MVVRIDSGPVEAAQKFREVPADKWRLLVSAKRTFLQTQLTYDCRCLVEFIDEAREVWEQLGYKSAEDMIRNGYELGPEEIEIAVAWLRHNEPNEAVSLPDIKSKVAAAKESPLAGHGEVGNGRQSRVDNVKSTGGNDQTYTLRRLARDRPDLLERVETGELSANAAAIEAGFRKKTATVPVSDADAAARCLVKHFTLDELNKAWRRLPAE